MNQARWIAVVLAYCLLGSFQGMLLGQLVGGIAGLIVHLTSPENGGFVPGACVLGGALSGAGLGVAIALRAAWPWHSARSHEQAGKIVAWFFCAMLFGEIMAVTGVTVVVLLFLGRGWLALCPCGFYLALLLAVLGLERLLWEKGP